ncbi:MAG: hypothetical protein ACLQDY_24370 [Streptosporangiaceae bacterium]
MSVQPFSSGSKVRPGHSASYAIFVWSRHGASKNVTVTLTANRFRHLGAPAFSVCPAGSGATCTIGDLPARQADELQAAIPVQAGAYQDEQVRLTASATAKDADGFTAAATVRVSKPASGQATPTPTPSASFPTVGSTTPAGTSTVTLPAPQLPSATAGASNPAGLFPTVSPGHSTSAPAARNPASGSARSKARRLRAETAAATLPLPPRLIGGQLLGLAILAGAIAMAVARLSLRTRGPQQGSGSGDGDKG